MADYERAGFGCGGGDIVHIAVCDDEAAIHRLMTNTIRGYSGFTEEVKITCFSSGRALVNALHDYTPDLVFLDIEMPRFNGWETARALHKHNDGIVIVILTAHSNMMVEGYFHDVAAFIPKSDLEEQFSRVMCHVMDKLDKRCGKSVEVTAGSEKLLLRHKDIVYIESAGRKVVFHTVKDSVASYKRLYTLERELEPDGFVRIHASYIVNGRHVERCSSTAVSLTSGVTLAYSRSFQAQAYKKFTQLMTGVIV